MKIVLSDLAESEQSLENITKDISSESPLQIILPFSAIGYTQSSLDIIRDYVEVSYWAEKIASYVKVIDGQIVYKSSFCEFVIHCVPENINLLAQLILDIAIQINGNDDDTQISFLDELAEYEDGFQRRVFVFPELANNYMANLINGAYWEIASEYESEKTFFNKTYRKHPEQRFGFWKSALSKKYKETIYFSTDSWIIPPKSDVAKALRLYSGYSTNLLFEKADLVLFKNSNVLVSPSCAVWFNRIDILKKSISCVVNVLNKEQKPALRLSTETVDNTQLALFSEYPVKVKRRRKSVSLSVPPLTSSNFNFYLSELGEVAIIENEGFNHVFFIMGSLNFEQIKELGAYLNPVYSNVQNLIAKSCLGKCDWNRIDEDQFEELCYDIIYCHQRFDSSTIQKMGKSKSRDGGRDITVKTKRTSTREPELFIFQCKFSKGNDSLSASKLSGAGNVIMQYGAKGYGVFTSLVIDSTLFDMMDGFERSMGIDTSFRWSKYELERYLNKTASIKNKYFT